MSLKGKNKGLLERAEEAIDESVELKDTVDEVAAVFEGISATFETNIDEAELEELDEMVGTAAEAPKPKAAASIPSRDHHSQKENRKRWRLAAEQ